jgi:CAI-1 autoinducer synthase
MIIQSVQSNTSKLNDNLPSFVKNRIEKYSTSVSRGVKNGRPLILGKSPSRNSLMLQSNDYLSISKNSNIIEDR